MEPFIGSAAVRRGHVSRNELARDYKAIYRDVYIRRDIELTAQLRARAAWLSTGATLCGTSAAAVHGTKWLNPNKPAEIVRGNRRTQGAIVAHTWKLDSDEVCRVSGVDATTAARTAFDIGRCVPAVHAVPILDALMHATALRPATVQTVADRHPGARGIAQLRSMLDVVDGGAESPQESKLRMLIVGAGLPRPETQIEFHDLRVRVDMGWRQWKVAVEYDGIQHWTEGRQRSWDIERIALLEDAGWSVIRVSAQMMSRPDLIVERVRCKLRTAGCLL